MRGLGPILIATVAILTAGADAQVHDLPPFAAFKTFCIDTGTSPDAVKSAVEAAGGKQRVPPSATASPWPMTVTIWDITTGGHSMWVYAGTQQVPPIHNRPEENSNHCTVSSFVNEDASIEAIRNWVGVPPDYVSRGNPILNIFHYQELGSRAARSLGTFNSPSRMWGGLMPAAANNPQQSWGFEGEPPEAVIKDFGIRDGRTRASVATDPIACLPSPGS